MSESGGVSGVRLNAASQQVPGGENPLLELRNISVRFGGTQALSEVSLRLARGEILGLCGENGAGKSTLMKVASGIYPLGIYTGQVLLDGEEHNFRSVQEAKRAGVVLIPQELLIAPDLSIEDNMFAGSLPTKRGLVAQRVLRAEAKKWLAFFGINVDPAQPAAVLSPAEQRLAVIAAALSRSARVLILDEPTASLSEQDAEHLFDHLRRLSEDGVPSVFISHRLDEVLSLCHRITVLRNGQEVGTLRPGEASMSELIRAMLGHELSAELERKEKKGAASRVPASAREVLRVSGLTIGDPIVRSKIRVEDASFMIREGEVLGLFGLVGSGRTEIARAIVGAWAGSVTGEVSLNGQTFSNRSPTRALARGMGMLTEDRKKTGLFPFHTISGNLAAARLQLRGRSAKLDKSGVSDVRRDIEAIRTLGIRPPRPTAPIETLSGGNQQKVVLGRWFECEPRLLILDEPTIGVDIGAREQIYEILRGVAQSGVAVMVISSDVQEIETLCDRAIVLRRGRVVADFPDMPPMNQLIEVAQGAHDDQGHDEEG
jgi:ABC-type sugar transport system ATPase subunit